MKIHSQQLDEQVESLFERCPELCGFSVRSENDELFVSDVGIAPRLSAQQYGEIFQDIARTLADFLEEEPEASELLKGRTFARTLH
jgi:phosphotransacetylase